MTTPRFTLLYIGGYGRSGSTLLDRMLGSMDGFTSMGEVYYLWERGILENTPCGCGAPFRDCDFWQSILCRAFPGGVEELPDALLQTRRLLERKCHLPHLLGWRAWPDKLGEASRRYVEAHETLYRAVAEQEGSRILVDSSNFPLFALHLRQSTDLNIKFLHLVRDPRGVAFSRQRRKFQPGRGYMETAPLAQVARRWALANSIMETMECRNRNYLRLRYEDMVLQPRETLEAITDFCQAGDPAEVLRPDRSVFIKTTHLCAGNPNRFEKGTIQLNLDLEWQEKMSAVNKAGLSALTVPWLLRYGYPLIS